MAYLETQTSRATPPLPFAETPMTTLSTQTTLAKPHEVPPRWFVVDAAGIPLGRLASQVASVLRGKNKALYTPHVDTGDLVVVINAEKVVITGGKLDTKFWYSHSGIPTGFKAESYRLLMARKHEFVIE